ARCVVVAMTRVLIKMGDRGTTTTIAVVSEEAQLTQSSINILNAFINPAPPHGQQPAYAFVGAPPSDRIDDEVAEGHYDGALVATRQPSGQISFQFYSAERIGADRLQVIQVGILAIGGFCWGEP